MTARLTKHGRELLVEKLDHLGRLILYTRQMDMLMNSEESVIQLAECFLNGNYNIHCRAGDNQKG